jgi:hypothetical protein
MQIKLDFLLAMPSLRALAEEPACRVFRRASGSAGHGIAAAAAGKYLASTIVLHAALASCMLPVSAFGQDLKPEH